MPAEFIEKLTEETIASLKNSLNNDLTIENATEIIEKCISKAFEQADDKKSLHLELSTQLDPNKLKSLQPDLYEQLNTLGILDTLQIVLNQLEADRHLIKAALTNPWQVVRCIRLLFAVLEPMAAQSERYIQPFRFLASIATGLLGIAFTVIALAPSMLYMLIISSVDFSNRIVEYLTNYLTGNQYDFLFKKSNEINSLFGPTGFEKLILIVTSFTNHLAKPLPISIWDKFIDIIAKRSILIITASLLFLATAIIEATRYLNASIYLTLIACEYFIKVVFFGIINAPLHALDAVRYIDQSLSTYFASKHLTEEKTVRSDQLKEPFLTTQSVPQTQVRDDTVYTGKIGRSIFSSTPATVTDVTEKTVNTKTC